MHTIDTDVIIIGAGVAGLSAALALAPAAGRRVTLLTKAALGQGGSSPWAQGGIAAAVGADDAPSLHTEDTLVAGAGLAVREVVDVLTHEGPAAIDRLVALGARFDRAADGSLALGREAAHQRRRILHACGDSTGAEVMRALTAALQSVPSITVHERCFVTDLARAPQSGRVVGATARLADGSPCLFRAPAVILASGGSGQLYRHTTNPPEATADGLAMALRAGARVIDLEFVQFHPTALVTGRDPMPLLTEALRGEGAQLLSLDEMGRSSRFMVSLHADAELAPRDIVARGIWAELAAGRAVYLDARQAVGEAFAERFPTVWRLCQESGLDPRREPLPVAPAAHYHMGGVAVDVRGRSSLEGLWACGEVAATGVHGANRLASNSLLEGLVFGVRVAQDVAQCATAPTALAQQSPMPAAAITRRTSVIDPALEARLRERLREVMWRQVGLVRDADGLEQATRDLEALANAAPADAGELHNLTVAALAVTRAAALRRESRGGHYRSDHPQSDPGLAGVRQVLDADQLPLAAAPLGRRAPHEAAAG